MFTRKMKLNLVRQGHENGGAENPTIEQEVMEMEPTDHDSPEIHASPENGSSPISPASNPTPLSEKSKRKSKELIDHEISPISTLKKKKKKKKSSLALESQDDEGVLETGGSSMSKGDATIGTSSTPVELKSPTLIRAEEVLLSLGNNQPSFLKVLVRSHVSSSCWMGLPTSFCNLYLPNEDTAAILENENGEEYPIKYIANKKGLSAGWRKFVAENKLLEGDVLVFQLIGTYKFKVYTIRANDLTEVDGALSLLNLEQTKQSDTEGTIHAESNKKRRPKSPPLTTVKKKKKKKSPIDPQVEQADEHSAKSHEEVASEVSEPQTSLHLKNINSFEEFHIVVNEVCIDSEMPEQTRRKYYELCCSKDAFLHERLLPGLSSKLVAGMIFEAVNTADAIQGCKLTTPRKEFEVWEKSLRSFELLGLNVGFLRARVRRLQNLAFDSEGALDARRFQGVKAERNQIEDEIRTLEEKIVELKELCEKNDQDMENLKTKAENYERIFQEEVNAPW